MDHAGERPFRFIDMPARNLGSAFAAFLLGIVSAGYLDVLYEQALGLFLPALATLALLFYPNEVLHRLSVPWLGLGFGLLVCLLVAAIFGSHSGVRSAGFAVFIGVPVLGLALLPGREFERFATFYALGATLGMVVWIFALLIAAHGELRPWGIWTPSSSVNNYGVHLNMLWPVLLMLSGRASLPALKAILILAALLALLGAMATFSRLAIVTALSLIAFIALRKSKVLGIMALIALAAVMAFVFSDEIRELLVKARLLDFKPDLGRFTVWQEVLRQSQNNLLFGHGPGGAKYVLGGIDIYHAHNDVLNLLLEGGLPAAIAGLAVLSGLAIAALRALVSPVAMYAGCSLLAYLASTLVSSSLTRPELTLTLTVVLGLYRHCLISGEALAHPGAAQ